MINNFQELIDQLDPGKVVDFDPLKDRIVALDFTSANTSLTDEMLADTDLFSDWIDKRLDEKHSIYGIGGYDEHRTIYSRSNHFNVAQGVLPRRLHLGVDIWGKAGTSLYNFADATVFGFANNNNFGDYGGTIILKYEVDGFVFYALYGHLSAASLLNLSVGQFIAKGTKFAEFGFKEENGYWPPHLHFQLILDMEGNISDYPGVCTLNDREKYLKNCPDPMLILNKTLKLRMS